MDPEYRNVAAFDFVGSELGALVRSLGVRKARIERSALVARALAKGLPERDVEAAITIMILGKHLAEEAGVVWFAPGRETWPLASSQAREGRDSIHSEIRATAYAIVKDVIERRGDGRPTSVEPLDAFADVLERLGYEPFRLWWKQLLSELRRSDTVLSPVTVSVLAAALVEGALTFVVEHARRLGLGVFGSRDFEREPRTWKIDDLVASASTGHDSAILDVPTRQRAEELIRVRQRIHAGRMLSAFPTGVADLRPEEAREAQRTADTVVRRVMDWLLKYPPAGGANTPSG
jgi:hypothetical protein